MKGYKTRREAKRSLKLQVAVLSLFVLIMSIAVRLKEGNLFTSVMLLPEGAERFAPSDLTLEWKKDPIPVLDYSIGSEKLKDQSAAVLYLSLLPEKTGEYELSVLDPDGKKIAHDSFHVGRYLTTYSEKTGNFTGDESVFLAAILLYSGLAVIMLIFFLRLKGPLICCYEAIFSFGVLIFLIVILVLEIPVYFRHMRYPELYQTWMFLDDIASAGQFFSFITFPLTVVFSLLLIISNIELLRHERPRIQNVLGLILGLSMTGTGLLYFFGRVLLPVGSDHYGILLMADKIAGVIFSYLECILFSSIVCGLRAAKHVPDPDRDYILILGCGFRKDGTLPPLLRGRVDRAMEFWYSQKKQTGKEAVIIPSGGQGRNETMPEAEAMYRYMVSQNFPVFCIHKEDRSVNTFQNMAFSKEIIENGKNGGSEAKVAFVTTNYHVFRSGVWAGLADLKAEGIGSRTKWWFWPNAFVRECIALLKNRLLYEIMFLIFLLAVSGLFTWLSRL